MDLNKLKHKIGIENNFFITVIMATLKMDEMKINTFVQYNNNMVNGWKEKEIINLRRIINRFILCKNRRCG